MQIYSDLSTLQLTHPTALTIGNFDGIHRGHKALLSELRQIATLAALSSAILTFDPHPLAVLRPHQPLHLLTTPLERLHLTAALGIDVGIIQPFTLEVAALEPAEFMGSLVKRLNVRALVVGPDFALGRNRSGNLDVLAELGKSLGYTVHVIEPVAWEDQPVRSSAIRTLLTQGDVEAAAALLGRPYHATGLVIHGDKRGRQIGTPTANLQIPDNKLWPADGVYATRTYLHQRAPINGASGGVHLFNSVTNLGMRPTVGGTEHRFETHLLDFPEMGGDDNLYGQYVTVEFIARLRGEQRFNGLDALITQIHADIAQARAILPTPVPLPDPFFLQAS
ncbi:MAG: bifunctional riboflavin kinase/FAD synthetase [Caldilineaceae bacterium]|nr:bifunctional riboflavin kinase/FAD synthetase [Caldilineaceae bacterium]